GTIGDGADEGARPEGVPPASFEPAPANMRRLLGRQYVNTVEDLLGAAAAEAAGPPGDVALNGFDSIGAAQLSIGDSQVVDYEASARAVAAAARADGTRMAELSGCVATGPDDAACHRAYVERFGRLAFRRTMTDGEVDRYVAIAQAAAEAYGEFDAGLEYATAAILEAPSFIYRIELGEPDPYDEGRRVLTGTEMASRLSYFLLDSTPSEDLLDLAESGGLDDAEGVRAAARDMLEEPKARNAVGAFYSELFKLRNLETLGKDQGTFPDYNPALAASMRGETLAFIEHLVFEEKGSFEALLSAPYTFVDPTLADFYGVEYPAGETGFVQVELPSEQRRAGLLSQAGILATFAHSDGSSPTLRGKFVRESLLCQSIPAPPNNVSTVLPPDIEAKTKKEKLSEHMENPSCKGCHVMMDPIGFALENFDGIGKFRELDNGAVIDATAEADDLGRFDGPAELGAALAEQPEVLECVVRNFYRHAAAHVEVTGEKVAIAKIDAAFAESGYQLKEMMVELVTNEAFRYVGVAQ
ncbi:MAG: DUF1592 domain-containing protein, partial [Myxococcales bacterium]|nr:DUF1592 domain-containing protein [Myxococcales bacterium]